MSGFDPAAIRWRDEQGEPVACIEKLKVLGETLTELGHVAQDAFEDGLLMGCAEAQLREVLRGLIERLDNPYRK